jgi:hypothetical protein
MMWQHFLVSSQGCAVKTAYKIVARERASNPRTKRVCSFTTYSTYSTYSAYNIKILYYVIQLNQVQQGKVLDLTITDVE